MAENRYDPLTVDRSKFPPNKKKEETQRPEQVAHASVAKPTTSNRLVKAIFAGDTQGLADKLVYDVLAPMIRDFIAGGIKNAVDMAFYGKANPTRGGYTDYARPSSVSYSSRSSAMSQETPRTRGIERNLIFDTREEAATVLDSMEDRIETYGQVTVLDLCDMVGVDGEFTDERYGWKSLRSAVVMKRGNKWIIDLPRVRVVD